MGKTGKKKDVSEKVLRKKMVREPVHLLEIEAAKEIVDEMFAVMDGVEGLVYVSDMQNYTLLRVNKQVKKLYGKNIVGKKCYEVFHGGSDGPCRCCTNDRLLIHGKPGVPVLWDFYDPITGRWYHCIDKAIRWPNSCFVRLEVAFDITDIKENEIALRDSEDFYNTIFESIQDPFCIIHSDYSFEKTNESYARMREKTVDELIGNRCFEVLHNRTDVCNDCVVRETFHTGAPQMKEKLTMLPSGAPIWVEIHTYPIFDENGKVTNVIEYTRDITARKRTETERNILIDRFQHLSRTDDLTGLLNRRALIEKLDEETRRSKRYGSKLALMVCDVDYFKEINDSYGHDHGDKVLQAIASLLNKSLRKTDIIGRYGGDEFFMVLPETPLENAQELAERIRENVEKFGLKVNSGETITTSVSIGIAAFNPQSEDMNDFVKRGDNALYAAKGEGRNRVYLIQG